MYWSRVLLITLSMFMFTVVELRHHHALLRSRVKKHKQQENGKQKENGEYHFVLPVIRYAKGDLVLVCTGTAVATTWTLSAASCVAKGIENLYLMTNISLPIRNITKSGRAVLRAVSHPSYTAEVANMDISSRNDIALLQTKPLDVCISKVSVVDYMSLLGRPVVHRAFSLCPGQSVPELRSFNGTPVPCDTNRPEPKICMRPMCSKAEWKLSKADRGAPLLYRNKIVGVTCDTATAGRSGSQYTPVSPHISWIVDSMEGESATKKKRRMAKREGI